MQELPQMSAAAEIQPDSDGNWTIHENGQVRASYPRHAIRFSVLWKAEVRNGESRLTMHITPEGRQAPPRRLQARGFGQGLMEPPRQIKYL